MNRYELPNLPYDYVALEPHISGRIMALHHDKHHRAYVDGANKAIEGLLEAREKDDFSQIALLEKQIAFNVSGHLLHSIFWRNLSPHGGDQPEGPLAEAIRRDFGSFEKFKDQLTHVASTLMGSGWAALVWEPGIQRLGTAQILDHDAQITPGSTPLLVLDAWEHSYYLQYENNKADYFKAIWNLWNWEDISARYERASQTKLSLDALVPEAGIDEHLIPTSAPLSH